MSAVRLNLTSSVLDERSPRETQRKDSDEPLSRECSPLPRLARLGVMLVAKMLFDTSHWIQLGL